MRTSRVARALPQASRAANPLRVLDALLDERADTKASTAWPSSYYSTRPLEFCDKILGVSLWSFQSQIVETIAAARKTSIAGGRKVGKDFAVACACLWFWACFPRAKVLLYGPKLESIDEILWAEVRNVWRDHGTCVACKKKLAEGKAVAHPCPHSQRMVASIGIGCETGLRSKDDRLMFGMVANPGGGGLRGLSGEYMFSVIDEACFVPDVSCETIEGNLASKNSKLAALTNPVKTSGWAWRSFHVDTAVFVRPDGTSSCLTCSSLDNPNITEGANIPGLASREWAEERRRVWGERSADWLTDVLGRWPTAESGQLFPLDVILERPILWDSTRHVHPVGRLCVGVDVIGEGRTGDRAAITIRRGGRVLEKIWTSEDLQAREPCTAERLLEEVLRMIGRWRLPSDSDENRPRVVIDADGREGARVFDRFYGHARNNYGLMLATAFHGGNAPKNPKAREQYSLTRDALFGGLVDWVNDGGTWPDNLRLRAQLGALRWVDKKERKNVLIEKSDLRKVLGGSPDELDSLALSTWLQDRNVADAPHVESEAAAPATPYEWHEPGGGDTGGGGFWGDSILRRG